MKFYDLRQEQQLNIKDFLQSREQQAYDEYEKVVEDILENVKLFGDKALLEYTKTFDNVQLSSLKVSEEEIEEAYALVPDALVDVMKKAYRRIYDYHMKQKKTSWFDTDANGSMLGQKMTPIERVGVYVPGGKAVYPSSVLMNLVPALVAGVSELIIMTPPMSNGKVHETILVAADICGVNQIYKNGGASAIGAMAYGTESIQKVDKIVGPGNIYVALAKKRVFGLVNIDSIAGPSEVLVIADESAAIEYVAADLLSQAEHDPLASSVLVTTDETLALSIENELNKQMSQLTRHEIMKASLNNYGAVILVNNIQDAVNISNQIAPEHLEICTHEPMMVMSHIKHAGAIFLGHYSPEPLGDYMAGPNHVLPTNGTARFFSPLNVEDYMKKSSIIYFNESSLKELKDDIILFATAEELTAHANAIEVRFKNE